MMENFYLNYVDAKLQVFTNYNSIYVKEISDF